MTNYHPDVQRAYDAHCADGYVVPDDETGPQEATGATESDETRSRAHGDGAGLREAVEDVFSRAAQVIARAWGDAYDQGVVSVYPGGLLVMKAARALAGAGLLVSEDTRGALDETLDDLTRTLARAEKAEARERMAQQVIDASRERYEAAEARAAELEAAWSEACEVAGKGDAWAERDRARDTAVALEAENARLTAKVERVEVLAATLGKEARSMSPCTGPNCGGCVRGRDAAHIRAALSDTTGEATR